MPPTRKLLLVKLKILGFIITDHLSEAKHEVVVGGVGAHQLVRRPGTQEPIRNQCWVTNKRPVLGGVTNNRPVLPGQDRAVHVRAHGRAVELRLQGHLQQRADGWSVTYRVAEVVHVLLTRSPPRADSRAARPGPGAGRTPWPPPPVDNVLISCHVDTMLTLRAVLIL